MATRHRIPVLLAALLVSFGLVVPASVAPASAATTAPGTFVPLTPTRLLDTRIGTGAPVGAVASGGSVVLTVVGAGGVPATSVGAIALNVTVTRPTAAGYITVYPSDQTQPTASNLNFVPDLTVPNMVVVPVSATGTVTLFNGSPGTADLIADVAGYFNAGATVATTTAGTMVPLTPSRVLDTRYGPAPALGAVPAFGSVTLQVTGAGGVPVSAAGGAAVLNVTVTDPTGPGYLTVYPSDKTRPTASNLNFVPGQTVPNLVVAPMSATGTVTLYNGSPGTVNLVADVSGYFNPGATTAEGTFLPLTPARVLDTRTGNGLDGTPTTVQPGDSVTLQTTGRGGVPAAGVGAVVLNVTVTDPTTPGFITAYPSNRPLPTASNLNFVPQQTVPDLVIVPVSPAGTVTLFNGSPGTVSLVADVSGYFRLPAGTVSGTVTAAAGGAALSGVIAYVIDPPTGDLLWAGPTDGSGHYTTGPLQPTTSGYDVCFDPARMTTAASPTGFAPQCYNGVPVTAGEPAGVTHVLVPVGGTTSGINASLATGGGIAGNVTAVGGAPLGGVSVLVVDLSAGALWGEVPTDATGHYSFPGLAPNAAGYTVCFDATNASGGSSPTGYASACYNSLPWSPGGAAPAGTTSVPVSQGTTATVNQPLPPA